jgi:hypothetical protein
MESYTLILLSMKIVLLVVFVVCLLVSKSRVWMLVLFLLIFYVAVWTNDTFWQKMKSLCSSSSRIHADQIEDIKDLSGIVLGGGWSFFLKKRRACKDDTARALQISSGRLANGRWLTGTTIRDVQKYLTSKGQTLGSYPSIESATLGGWIASSSHGSGGTLWKPQFGRIKVYDQRTQDTFEDLAKNVFSFGTTYEEQKNYIVLEAEIYSVPNVLVRRECFKLNRLEDATRFLETPTYLRMAQIGARGTMFLLWKPADDSPQNAGSPPLGSQFSLWFQSDVLSMFQSHKYRREAWFSFPVQAQGKLSSEILLSDANSFTIEPPKLLFWIGLLYINYEFIIVDIDITSAILYALCEKMSDAFKDLHGRCELRCGSSILFLDIVHQKGADNASIFSAIFESLGRDITYYFHRGKSVPP